MSTITSPSFWAGRFARLTAAWLDAGSQHRGKSPAIAIRAWCCGDARGDPTHRILPIIFQYFEASHAGSIPRAVSLVCSREARLHETGVHITRRDETARQSRPKIQMTGKVQGRKPGHWQAYRPVAASSLNTTRLGAGLRNGPESFAVTPLCERRRIGGR